MNMPAIDAIDSSGAFDASFDDGALDGLPAHEYRPGQSPTLIFLHYWGGSSRTWKPVVDRLPRQATITVDFRGWGRSTSLPGPYGLNQLARDTLDLIATAVRGTFVLVGHSMGGKVAQLVAAEHPQGLVGIVLVGPAPAKPADHITPDYQSALALAYDSEDSVTHAVDNVLTAGGLSAEIKAQVLLDSRASAPQARSEWPLEGIAQDITTETQRIDVPALVLAGEHDIVEPVDVLRHNLLPYLPRAELAVIGGTGHLMPLENPDALARHISAFVGGGEPGSEHHSPRSRRYSV